MQSTTKKQTEFFPKPLAVRAAQAAPIIAPFVSRMQSAAIAECFRGEEKNYFMQKVVDLAELIDGMATTYEQDGKGDQAIVFLHYFHGDSHWFITEKDETGGVDQAFGYAILHGDEQCAELGYISIRELTRCNVELDFYFSPRTLADVKAERAKLAA